MTHFKNENFIDKILEFIKEPCSQVKDSTNLSATAYLLEATKSQLVKPAFLKSLAMIKSNVTTEHPDLRPALEGTILSMWRVTQRGLGVDSSVDNLGNFCWKLSHIINFGPSILQPPGFSFFIYIVGMMM